MKLQTIQFKDVWPDPTVSICVKSSIESIDVVSHSGNPGPSLNRLHEILILNTWPTHIVLWYVFRQVSFLPIRFYSGMCVFLLFWSFVFIQTSGEHPYQQLPWTLSNVMVQGQHSEIPSRRDFLCRDIVEMGSILYSKIRRWSKMSKDNSIRSKIHSN